MEEIGLYYFVARWMDPVTAHFSQPDSLIPDPKDTRSFDRYAYTTNPIKYTDPSGHCSVNAHYSVFLGALNIIPAIQACVSSISSAVDAYEEGDRRAWALAARAGGYADLARETADWINSLNVATSTVFSDAPIEQRLPAAIYLGGTSVGIAANVVGGAQLVRGGLAFSRGGSGGSDYFVKGTERMQTFMKGDELFRVYGGEAAQKGTFAFTQNPGNQITAISKGALPTGNSANMITRINFSGPVRAEVSRVAPLFGQPGGATQVRLPYQPYIVPNWYFSTGQSLPIGLMPLVTRDVLRGATSVWSGAKNWGTW